VIDAEQAALSLSVERDKGDIVVVVTKLSRLRGGALIERIEGGRVGE
jgi:hypothetical protein